MKTVYSMRYGMLWSDLQLGPGTWQEMCHQQALNLVNAHTAYVIAVSFTMKVKKVVCQA